MESYNTNNVMYSRIKFPNQHGKRKADPVLVKKLQDQYHFSDQYATFLITQNGLDLDNPLLPEDLYIPEAKGNDFQPPFDLRYLYDFNSHSEYTDVVSINKEENSFLPYFFYIARGYDGSAFAEICFGKDKGKVVFINGEIFVGGEDYQEIANDLGISKQELEKLTPEEMITLLLNPEQDLVYIVANSFDEFINTALIYNLQNQRGEVIDLSD